MKEIAPGLYQITVPIPYPLKTVHLYLLQGDGEVALVDSSLDTRTARGSLELALAELGLCFKDLTHLLLTHHHPDHYGLAGVLEAQGAQVYLHPEEIERGHRFWREPEAFEEASYRLFLDHGTPEEALLGIREVMAKTRARVHPPKDPIPLEEGKPLEVAGQRLWPLWTPGHADGHLAFLTEEGILLAGDAILERVSPNVGFWAYTRPDPLGDFLASLRKLQEVGAKVAYPGHFGAIEDVAGRAEELIRHHEARLGLLLQALDRPRTAWELSLLLFPQDLDPAGRRFAFAETLAHLEHLRLQGAVDREGVPYRYVRV